MLLHSFLATVSKTRLIAVLIVSQLCGWGMTFQMPSVLGRAMERDLKIPYEVIFIGLTVMMLTGAVIAPRIGHLLKRYGAARVLASGNLILATGLGLLSGAQGAISYFAAWFVIGLGGACALTVPANTAIVERHGAAAKHGIGLLMIFTGLGSTIFWPILNFGEVHMGWRMTLLVGAGIQALCLLPLHLFALPPLAATTAQSQRATPEPPVLSQKLRLRAFSLIAIGISLFTLSSFGLSAQLIAVLKLAGAAPEWALTLASSTAVIAMVARFGDMMLGSRISPALSALGASFTNLVAMLILMLFSPAAFAPFVFIVLYGAGSGVISVIRAVLPLGFFSSEEFALLSSRVALPQNIAAAFSPVLFAAAVENFGLSGTLGLAMVLTFSAFVCMFGLWRLSIEAKPKPPSHNSPKGGSHAFQV